MWRDIECLYLFLVVPKFLIVAATSAELEALVRHFKIQKSKVGEIASCLLGRSEIAVLITGVGMVNTAFELGRHAHNKFDYIINAGICGAFNRSLATGEVIQVVEDTFSELGAEDDEQFIKAQDMQLDILNSFHSRGFGDCHPLLKVRKVKGITVNTVHGNECRIKKVVDLYQPDVESMEGAAFFRACSNMSANCIQLRSVSNYVEKRDKSKWQIPLAIRNLNEFVIKFIEDLSVESKDKATKSEN
jgi:futalosine hydrolase